MKGPRYKVGDRLIDHDIGDPYDDEVTVIGYDRATDSYDVQRADGSTFPAWECTLRPTTREQVERGNR